MVASLAIAHAASARGDHVQVFPEFGVERRGVPVTAFARIDSKPIRLRTKITHPDHVLILDPALARYLPVTGGLRENGSVVMNSTGPKILEPFRNGWRLAWLDATTIASSHKIGTATAPIVNTAMVGAFAAVTKIFEMDHVRQAMAELFPNAVDRNCAAALQAYEEVQILPSSASEAIERLYTGGTR